jgi:hypothetical protein
MDQERRTPGKDASVYRAAFSWRFEAQSTHVYALQADDFNVGLRNLGREREVR